MEEVKDEEDLLKEDKYKYLQAVKKLRVDSGTLDEKLINIKRNEDLLNKLHL